MRRGLAGVELVGVPSVPHHHHHTRHLFSQGLLTPHSSVLVMAGAEEDAPPTLSGASLRSIRPPVRSAARGKCGGGHAGGERKVRGVWSSRGRLLPAGSPAGKTGVACSSSSGNHHQPAPRLSASPAALKPTKPVISAPPRPLTRPTPTRAHPSPVQCPTKNMMKGQLLTSEEVVVESVMMAGGGNGGVDGDSSAGGGDGSSSHHLLRRAAKSMVTEEEEEEEDDDEEEEEDTEDVEEEGGDGKTGKRRAARYDSADSSDRLVACWCLQLQRSIVLCLSLSWHLEVSHVDRGNKFTKRS